MTAPSSVVPVFVLSRSAGAADLDELADVLDSAAGPVAVLDEALLMPRAALAPVLDDPMARTRLLLRPARSGGDVRVRHHRVMSVGSSWHEVAAPDHVWTGAALVAQSEAHACAGALRAMAVAWRAGQLGDVPSELNAPQLFAVALIRSSAPCEAVTCVDVPWFRAPMQGEALAAAQRDVASVPAERIARLQANRVDDGFYSTFVVRRLSKPLTRLALRLGLSPNAITLMSFAVGLGAALLFALGTRWSLIAGALALQLSLVIDCVDGEVARSTRRFTALGAWLDAWTDRVKEFCAYAGLAWGSAAVLGVDVWPVAVVLVVLQTTRHVSDYDFSRVQWQRESAVPAQAVEDPTDWQDGGLPSTRVAGAMAASTQLNARDAVRWTKRAIHLPIGERWLIISVVAAVSSGAWALWVLLVCGLLALAYVVVGRVLRTLTWQGPTPQPAQALLRRQGDVGPLLGFVTLTAPSLAPWVNRWAGVNRWAWCIPALLRLGELGLVAVLVLTREPSLAPLAFAWVAVVAFHHYDVLYRALGGVSMPRWLTWSGLGWDGRSLVIIAAAIAGAAALANVLGAGAIILGVVLVVVASVQWLLRSRVPVERIGP